MASSKQPARASAVCGGVCVSLRENVTRPAGFSYQEGFSSLFTLKHKLPGARGSDQPETASRGCVDPRRLSRGCHESHTHPKKIASCLYKRHTDACLFVWHYTKHKLIPTTVTRNATASSTRPQHLFASVICMTPFHSSQQTDVPIPA